MSDGPHAVPLEEQLLARQRQVDALTDEVGQLRAEVDLQKREVQRWSNTALAARTDNQRLRDFVIKNAFRPCHYDGPGWECVGCGRWASTLGRLAHLVHARDCELAAVLGLRLRG